MMLTLLHITDPEDPAVLKTPWQWKDRELRAAMFLLRPHYFGSHLGTLALKTENFSKMIGHFSKTRKWIY